MLDEEINVVSQRREGDLLHQGFEAFGLENLEVFVKEKLWCHHE